MGSPIFFKVIVEVLISDHKKCDETKLNIYLIKFL